MTFSIVFFHLFLGLPLFEPLTTKFFAFTGALSSFIFSICPNIATSALSRTPSSSPHLSFHELSHCLYHLIVFYHKIYVAFSFQQFVTFSHLLSLKPNIRHHNIKHFLHNFYTSYSLSFSETTLLHSTLAIFLNFFDPHLTFAIAASRTSIELGLGTFPRYKNFCHFF